MVTLNRRGTAKIGFEDYEGGSIKIGGEATGTDIGFFVSVDGGVNNGAWIKFGDNTIQTTAGLPLTGGTD
jgi:hypothetical protein